MGLAEKTKQGRRETGFSEEGLPLKNRYSLSLSLAPSPQEQSRPASPQASLIPSGSLFLPAVTVPASALPLQLSPPEEGHQASSSLFGRGAPGPPPAPVARERLP